MTYSQLAYIHLATIFPAFLIGAYMLFNVKGTQIHKKLGQIYMLLILVSSFISLFMTAELGPQLFNHFGFIHVFSLLVLWCIPAAYMAAKQGNLQAHNRIYGRSICWWNYSGRFIFINAGSYDLWFIVSIILK